MADPRMEIFQASGRIIQPRYDDAICIIIGFAHNNHTKKGDTDTFTELNTLT